MLLLHVLCFTPRSVILSEVTRALCELRSRRTCGCCCFVFAVAVARSPQPTPNKTSSRPKAAHFAAAVERSLYFVFVLAPALAFSKPATKARVPHPCRSLTRHGWECTPSPSQLLLLPLAVLCLCCCLCLSVLRRHSERSEESPHFRGERSDPSAFSSTHPNTVISTGAAHGFIVSSGAEKPASLPKPPPNPNRRLCLCSLLPHPVFLVNPPNTLNPCPQTRSTWRTSFTQPAKLVKESKKAPATSRGFPV